MLRMAAATAAAPKADWAAARGVAGLPGAVAVARIVDSGHPGGRRLCERADRNGGDGDLDGLERDWGPVHFAAVFVGGFPGMSVSAGGAAVRAARVAAGDAVERAADCGGAIAGVGADVWPAGVAVVGGAAFSRHAIAVRVSAHYDAGRHDDQFRSEEHTSELQSLRH